MATSTARFGLRKPATTDVVSVTSDLNENWDRLDAAIAGVPQAADKTIYVGAGSNANDANDGLSPYSAKATIAAAKTALGGTAGRILVGYGTFTLAAQLDVDAVGSVLEGTGYGTNIVVTSAMTSAIRVVDAGRCLLRDFRLTINTGGAVTNGILVTTSAASIETTRLDNIFVTTNGGTMTNAVWLGDVSGDTSEVTCINVRVSGATNAGFKLGTGSSNNVLNFRFYGCDTRANLYGVEIGGSGITWLGGSASGNSGADFKQTSPGTAPIVIEGVRSESSKKFWECTGNFTGVNNVTLRAIQVRSYTEAAGKVIEHASAGALIIDDFFAFNGVAPTAFSIGAPNATNKLRLLARGVCTEVDNPFGTLSNVIPDIRGTMKRNAGDGKIIDSTHLDATDTLIAPFSKAGTLTVAAGAGRFRFPFAATILGVTAAVGTAPTGAAIILDVHKNGTTIFTTQANRPQIAISANATAAEVTNMDVTSVASGDYFTVDVDQIGSTLAGADLSVFLRYRLVN